MQTLAILSHHFEPVALAVAAHGERATRFDHRENTDQPFAEPIAFRDGARLGFFGMTAGGGGGGGQVQIRTLGFSRHLLRVGFQPRAGGFGIGGEVFEQDVLGIQEAGESALGVEARQVAFEDQTIKRRECAGDHVVMYTQKSLHGLSPGIMVGVGPSGFPL